LSIRIGISGWTYPGWRGVFYPPGLAHRNELAFASRQFNAIEVNGTFYRLQRPETFAEWYRATPDDFRFALKGSRFITHMKALKDVRVPLANFFASGVLMLEDKLGPLLWQFPPRMRFDPERFDTFLRLLPRTTRAAARLARQHDYRLQGRAYARSPRDFPIRHVIEVRDETFFVPDFIDLLRHHDCGFVLSEAGSEWPYAEDVTSSTVYIRLHGAEELYASGYDDASLDWWARRIRTWARGCEPRDAVRAGNRAPHRAQRDVYVFFDNDRKVHAPFDARRLIERIHATKAKAA